MSKNRSAIRNRIEYAFFQIARFVARSLSPKALSWIGGHIGSIFSLVGGRRQEIIDFNLRLAFPEKTDSERRVLRREVSRHFGRTALDTLRIQSLRPEQLQKEVNVIGWENVEKAMALDRGAFFLTAHIGCWEVVALIIGLRLNADFAMVNRPLDNPLLESELDGLRRLYGARVFGKRSIAREMIRQLKAGGGIGILIDQRVNEDVGVAVPFFGHSSWTHPVLARMVRRTGAPVIPLFAFREGPASYSLRFDPAVTTDNLADADLEDEALTARFMAILEDGIRERPEQWLWYHDRWRDIRIGEQ